MKMKERLKNQKGLTLIELLAVIVILGIIAAIAIPSVGNIINNSKYGAIKSDALMILNAAKLYEAENGSEPTTGAQVKDYIEGEVTSIDLDDEGTVFVTDGKFIALSGEGVKDTVKVKFTSATVSDINIAPKKYTGGTTGVEIK